jgi:hypothetical protein
MAELTTFRLTSPDTVYGEDVTPSLFGADDVADAAAVNVSGSVVVQVPDDDPEPTGGLF